MASEIPATPAPTPKPTAPATAATPATAVVLAAPVAAATPKTPTPTAPKAAAPALSKAVAPLPPAASPVPPEFVLPAAVYSPQLLESVTYDIERYLDWYRQTQIQKKVGAKADEEPNHSDETVLVIEAWLNGRPATLEGLEKLLATLRGLKMPQVHIMLAALPNRAQREAMVNWFRNNVGPGMLLSFVADRNLGGGAVIRTPNHVYDYSWKQQLINGRGKLAEILARV